jgi:release factor glutamine methyltransferase
MPPDFALRALLAEGESVLASGPHPERARLDAETLLLHVLAKSDPPRNRAWLLTNPKWEVSTEIAVEYRALIGRRLAGEPVQYVFGECEFYGLPFEVTRDVLIPRPETEHLVEKVIDLAAHFAAPRIVDIGTGSGAIAVALAVQLPSASISATDLSCAALNVARRNAQRNRVAERIRFLSGDLLAPVAGERFEIVVANPPYVAAADRESLAVEVRDFEPPQALFSGPGGCEVYRRLIPAAFAALVPGGAIALEIGYAQQAVVGELMAATGFREVEFTADLQGIPRIASARRP